MLCGLRVLWHAFPIIFFFFLFFPYRLLSFQVFKEMFPYFFVLSHIIILLLKSQWVCVCIAGD